MWKLCASSPRKLFWNIRKGLLRRNWPRKEVNLVHLFATSTREFEKSWKSAALYKSNTSIIIWISWRKKSAGIPTGITEDVIRCSALGNGLADIKVCAGQRYLERTEILRAKRIYLLLINCGSLPHSLCIQNISQFMTLHTIFPRKKSQNTL